MNGGARKGAGRKKGGMNSTRAEFRSHFTDKEIKDFIIELKKQALSGKRPYMLQFVVEQLFGKAPQRLEVTGEDGAPLVIELSKTVAKKNGIVPTE